MGQAKALTCTLQMQNIVNRKVPSWHYICCLHMDTKVLECCMVTDIRTILDYAPNFVMYSDFYLVHWHQYNEVPEPQCMPEQMFKMLMHPKNQLKWLSLTNYNNNLLFLFHISPVLQHTSSLLQYLELLLSNFYFSSTEYLNMLLLSMVITLPTLRSLKVNLNNVTFTVLVLWEMSLLTNLSILSTDFSYAGSGFMQFFAMHGTKLHQLELDPSPLIEEHYLLLHAAQLSDPTTSVLLH